MLKILHLHWVVNRRSLWQGTPLWLLWAWITLRAASGQEPEGEGMFLMTALCFGLAFTLLALFNALGESSESFVLSLPAGRAQVVDGTYLAILVAATAGTLFPFALVTAFGRPFPPDGLRIAALIAGALVLASAVFLPLRFRWGVSPAACLVTGLLLMLLAGLHLWQGLAQGILWLADGCVVVMNLPWPLFSVGIAAWALLVLASRAASRHAYLGRSF